MKILWLTYDLPYPPNSGGKLRAFNILKLLSRKFEITLFSYYRKEEQKDYIPELLKFVSRVEVFKREPVWRLRNLMAAVFSNNPLLLISYLNNDLAKRLGRYLTQERFDLVHLEFFGVFWLLPYVKSLGVPVVLGNENIEYQIYQKYRDREKNPFLRLLMGYDIYKLKRKEEIFWKAADINLAVSAEDKIFIESRGVGNCYLVPNGVDLPYYRNFTRKEFSGPGNRALFTGNLHYQQNSDAVKWFLEEVMPRVKDRIDDFKLVVVSAYKPSWLEKFSDVIDLRDSPYAEFTDFVKVADIFVLPVWVKSGTNVKLLQALASGLPTVSTSAGVSGYDFTDGDDLFVADTPENFAGKVVLLSRDLNLRKRFSENALNKMGRYDWNYSAEKLGDVYEKFKSA